MLLRWIESIRRKPKYVREQYAFFGAIGVTILIAAVWSVSLPTRFANLSSYAAPTQSQSTIGAFFSDIRTNLSASVSRYMDGLVGDDLSDSQNATTTTDSRHSSPSLQLVPQLSPETIKKANQKPILIEVVSSSTERGTAVGQ